MPSLDLTPGSLISARGREWVVLTGSDAETVRVRPLSGSEEDQSLICIGLEPISPASFPAPQPWQMGNQDSALLLRDALLLSLRRGAGPFRSFGQIAVEPRAYQLVPLLMALRQAPIRLLVADDVGVGKTIEAALIARELVDRGEIARGTVLCPPHLVEQWTKELNDRFHLHAVPVTAGSAARLERDLPQTESIFSAHPFTVVSLDYIKSETRRADFLRACPDFVIVDEAHTCAAKGQGRHKRYELLKGLASSPTRHMVLLTATPHSGDDDAFYKLLGLLEARFEGLKEATGAERENLRERLSNHFVQRRRPDIAEWKEGSGLFPKRETKELTYRLTGAWDRFFEGVLDYCANIVQSTGTDDRKQRLSFWGTLALMRCVASSPAAAAQALRSHADPAKSDQASLEESLFDGADDLLSEDDVEPPAALIGGELGELIEQADRLRGQAGDPKLKLLVDHLEELLRDGFNPVVFCRYIATAHYLGAHLQKRFAKTPVTVQVVTGELTSDDREAHVERLADAEQRILVATDCLSEGVNLQESFDAVIHYDLSWNPTRHEQREGRVDRFGQESPTVRATLVYGANNPVDGAVLEVILRKAERIRVELGVPVPLPDESHSLTQALMKAVLLRHKKGPTQEMLDFASSTEGRTIDRTWRDAAEKAKANRTVFAQRRLKPDEVLPEWHKSLAAMGTQGDVERFTQRALARLGSGQERTQAGAFKVALKPLPEDVRERLDAEGISGTPLISFSYPPARRSRPVQRSHPLVSVLAESLLERTLGSAGSGSNSPIRDASELGRVGCWVSGAVSKQTTLALLRLRHQLVTQRAGKTSTLMVEEAGAVGWDGTQAPRLIEGLDALRLLEASPDATPPNNVAARTIKQALELVSARGSEIEAFALRRADALLADHERVRKAGGATGKYSVKALLPLDVLGVFVLLPKVG